MHKDRCLHLDLIGRFRLYRDEQEIRLTAGKTLLMLAFLACAADRTARRDRLASLFWQESGVDQARASLRQTLSRLRNSLGDARTAIWSDNDQIGLTRNHWTIDVDSLIACEKQVSTEVDPRWASPFLSGVHQRDPSIDAWLEGERHRLKQVAGKVFQSAIDRSLASGNADRALELGIRLNTLDPYAEPIHRSVMLAYEMKGDRSSALRQYRTLARLLDDGLGVTPDEQTRLLFERLRHHNRPNTSAPRQDQDSINAPRTVLSDQYSHLNAFEHSKQTVERQLFVQAHTPIDTPSGLRLVTVVALRNDDVKFSDRARSDIDAMALQQGGEPVLPHGAETLYVFGLDGLQPSGAETAFRFIRQLGGNTSSKKNHACGCASGLVSFDENGRPVGTVVQRAARLALLAEEGEIVIDRAVRAQMSTQIEVSEFNLRGKVCYRVMNLQSRGRAIQNRLFGRRIELAQLHQLLRDSKSHGAAMAVVSAEAGMGKTHLMMSLEQFARQENCQVLRVAFRTHEASRKSLTARLVRLLHNALIESGGLNEFDTVQRSTLNRILATHRETRPQEPQENERQHRFDLLLTMIDRVSLERPALVIAEDCHWAEPTDIELMIDLIDAQSQRPVLMVFTERRENETVARVLQSRVTEVDVLSLTLTPLSKKDAHALVESMVADEQAQSRILERAGGHPLFLTQLALADLAPDTPVPDSIVALVQGELDRLSDRARVACLKASILGPEFTLVSIQSVFPDIDSFDLLQSKLFVSQDGALNFRHALVHEAVYTLLSPEDTARLHQRVALHFHTIDPGEYAHHALLSGDAQMAIDACVAASEWYLSENRQHLAQRMVERGLQLKPEGNALARLLLSSLHGLRDRGELEAAIAASRQAHDCATDAGLKVQALLHAATLLKRRNLLERASAQLRQASDIANEQSIPDNIHAELEHEWGNNMFMRGQPDRCRQHHRRAQQLAKQANDIRMQAASLGGLGDAYYAGGRVQSAYRHYLHCVQLADSSGLQLIAIAYRPMLGFTANFLEPGSPALKILFRAVEEANRWQSKQYEMLSCLTIAEPLTMALRIDESATYVRRLRELQTTFGGQRFDPDICYLEAMNAWTMGDFEMARRRAVDGVGRFGGDVYSGAMLQGLLAFVSDDESVTDEALNAGESLLVDGGLAHNRVNLAMFASACHWRRGHFDQAQSVVEHAQLKFGTEPVGLLDLYSKWMKAASGANQSLLDAARVELDQHNQGLLSLTHPPVGQAARNTDEKG